MDILFRSKTGNASIVDESGEYRMLVVDDLIVFHGVVLPLPGTLHILGNTYECDVWYEYSAPSLDIIFKYSTNAIIAPGIMDALKAHYISTLQGGWGENMECTPVNVIGMDQCEYYVSPAGELKDIKSKIK